MRRHSNFKAKSYFQIVQYNLRARQSKAFFSLEFILMTSRVVCSKQQQRQDRLARRLEQLVDSLS